MEAPTIAQVVEGGRSRGAGDEDHDFRMHIEKHLTGTDAARLLLRKHWERQSGAETVDSPRVRTELLATPEGAGIDLGLLLGELLVLFGGERAFAFEIEARGAGPAQIGTCLASRDVDGDPVSSPTRKVATALILEAAESRAPMFEAWEAGSSEDRAERSLLVLPAVSRGATRIVFVIENRFRNLELDAGAITAARAYVDHAAVLIDLEAVLAENGALWQDLTRLRSATPRPAAPAEPTARSEAPARPAPSRRGLKGDYSMIVGSSTPIVEILQVIDRISGSTAPILINGESGTGKELIALAVHQNSPRRGKPFISENCAAITETLLESELFGYVRGAFTGANKDHKGLFEVADGGTLFLDEVGDMSPSMQKKLLRVLQEGVIRRVGAKESTPVDVRIISATNKDLLDECRAGNFREDLYYRLNVVNLKLPALRDRREDIPELVEFFLTQACGGKDKSPALEPDALERLVEYSWPGNVRELQNEIRRLCALSDGDRIRRADLSGALLDGEDARVTMSGDWIDELSRLTLREATELVERELIRRALRDSGGNKSLVAKALQIPKTSLYNKIHKYGL